MRCIILLCVSLLVAAPLRAADEPKLIIHEWGTFTSLQDESGRAIGGINVDDEPLPTFVQTLSSSMITNSPGAKDLEDAKGYVPMHPDVTMRLETPVMYFYPPRGTKLPMTVDVSVEFRGGWLTQFYPGALPDAAGFTKSAKPGTITERTVSRLNWKKLRVGTNADGPKTDSRIWIAPRKVNAVSVTSSTGESERYLFYRGVGHLESPLKVVWRSKDGPRNDEEKLLIDGRADELANAVGANPIDRLWLVEIGTDKRVAFRRCGPFNIMTRAHRPDQLVTATFTDADRSSNNLDRLRADMTMALTNAGLFREEAEAMLATWDRAYFQSPGLRLFYIVPQAWTDRVLTLNVSTPADITRVMVGRIELVTPRDRELVDQLLKGALSPEAAEAAQREVGRFVLPLQEDAKRQAAAATSPVTNATNAP